MLHIFRLAFSSPMPLQRTRAGLRRRVDLLFHCFSYLGPVVRPFFWVAICWAWPVIRCFSILVGFRSGALDIPQSDRCAMIFRHLFLCPRRFRHAAGKIHSWPPPRPQHPLTPGLVYRYEFAHVAALTVLHRDHHTPHPRSFSRKWTDGQTRQQSNAGDVG
jgi:hypothetical protein